ncbi:MAG: hypothetical protein ACYC6F_01835 [Longimicrobiales bacterium]
MSRTLSSCSLRAPASVLCALLLPLVVATCVDAPSAPEGTGSGGFVIAPVFSLVGPGGERPMMTGQADALSAAFDRVDRFRMVVKRAADNVVVLDTVIVVSPGQSEYDLTVPISAKDNEQFLVTITAMQGTTTLFAAENIPAAASPVGVPGSTPPAAVQIPLVYTGPGATATSVTVAPMQVVLTAGGSATVGSAVKDASGAVVAGVPLAWATSAAGVATVTAAGVVTASGEGVAMVTATTPTGLAASATVYVASGELAYVEAGSLKVRGVATGTSVQRATAGASQPSWSPDGAKLYYVSGGQVWRADGSPLSTGSWPSVSPDGTKLAVERGGQVWFVNDDGSEATQGPAGTAPVWADASTLLVGGGSVQRVRADGTGRTTVVEGSAALPALAGDGRIASVVAGELRVTGVSRALLTGATGRPSWSPNGRWLVVGTASGLVLVPADGSAEGVVLPGLAGASDPAFKRTGSLAPAPSVSVAGFNPDPPIPGTQVQVLGSGFDWIIRANNRVIWPTRDGSVESQVGAVTEGSITTTMPRNVIAGQVRVQTRASSGLLAFVPTVGSLEVSARTPWGGTLVGVGVALSGPSGPASGTTDAGGSLVLPGLIPGSYTATISPPTGWELVGERVRTLAIGAEAFALTLELTPVIASVTLSPAAPSLAVGSTLGVTLVVMGADGQSIPQVQGLTWRSGSAEMVVTPGAGLGATLSATFPGEAAGSSVLEASFGGRTYTFPVTVTSSISGTLTKETGVVPAPAVPDVTVQVRNGGIVVAEARSGADGRYAVSGLFRGTYDVLPQPVADLLPVPSGQTVILDAVNPSGRADFKMVSFAGLDVSARTPWDTPVAGLTVALLDAAGAEIAKGSTDGLGVLSLLRLTAGSYTLEITAPAGFTLTGEASRSLTLNAGIQNLALEARPLVHSVATVPEKLSVDVGSALNVELIPKDIAGNTIPQVEAGQWRSTGHLDAGGLGLKGQIGGKYPSEPDGAQLAVEINGQILTVPVTVTSHVQGTVTEQTEVGLAPAPRILITVEKDGIKVGEAGTDGTGSYLVKGLLAGTYVVKAIPPEGKVASPTSTSITLGSSTPTGSASFVISSATPSSGAGEVIVLGDINYWGSYGSLGSANNREMTRNFVTNAGRTRNVWYRGHNSWLVANGYGADSYFGETTTYIRSTLGMTLDIVETGSTGSLSIPADAASFWIWMPQATFNSADIAAINGYLAAGGRVILIGENDYSGFDLANARVQELMNALGSNGIYIDGCLYGFTSEITPDPLMQDVAAINTSCTSYFVPNAGDQALVRQGGRPVVMRLKLGPPAQFSAVNPPIASSVQLAPVVSLSPDQPAQDPTLGAGALRGSGRRDR